MQVEILAEVVLRPLAFAHQMAADTAANTQQQQQQQQRQQRLRLPWEGRTRLDPRSALNSCGRTPAAVAAVLRQPQELLMLLEPETPILQALEAAGVRSAWLGVPSLAVSCCCWAGK